MTEIAIFGHAHWLLIGDISEIMSGKVGSFGVFV
jgi:hypothetical protein